MQKLQHNLIYLLPNLIVFSSLFILSCNSNRSNQNSVSQEMKKEEKIIETEEDGDLIKNNSLIIIYPYQEKMGNDSLLKNIEIIKARKFYDTIHTKNGLIKYEYQRTRFLYFIFYGKVKKFNLDKDSSKPYFYFFRPEKGFKKIELSNIYEEYNKYFK